MSIIRTFDLIDMGVICSLWYNGYVTDRTVPDVWYQTSSNSVLFVGQNETIMKSLGGNFWGIIPIMRYRKGFAGLGEIQQNTSSVFDQSFFRNVIAKELWKTFICFSFIIKKCDLNFPLYDYNINNLESVIIYKNYDSTNYLF